MPDSNAIETAPVEAHSKPAMLTYKFRLRDSHSRTLNRMARDINVVWNYCNATQQEAVRRGANWLTWIDFSYLVKGSSKQLSVSADSIIQTCREYDKSRRSKGMAWLRFRGHKRLGWIPFKKGNVRLDGKSFRYFGQTFKTMHCREFPAGAELRGGSFNQDGRGSWYINIGVKVPVKEQDYSGAIGIDLGLKDLATTSDGTTIEAPQFYRKSEKALGTSQRARKTKRTRAISRKVANRRKDFLHKQANSLVRQYGTIIVGDVSPSKLTKTRMAKSVNDASWATFKDMLRYKSVMNGGRMIEVNEAYTTQTCSECGSMPAERPEGLKGLGIRQWSCGDCGAVHDRDVNAARNIARIGLDTLAEGVAA